MRFFLMQRNHPVAVIEIAEKTGDIIDVAEVLSAQRIPLAAYSLRRTSACQMQRAEPLRPVLGHALRCPTELARCKFLRERLF